jgi:hypothetical protein
MIDCALLAFQRTKVAPDEREREGQAQLKRPSTRANAAARLLTSSFQIWISITTQCADSVAAARSWKNRKSNLASSSHRYLRTHGIAFPRLRVKRCLITSAYRIGLPEMAQPLVLP